jgi:thiol-disulfide isomerase/thioredoxin
MTKLLLVLCFVISASCFAWAQEKPSGEKAQRVVGKLPAKALCLICSQGGESEEKPAGAVLYKGKTYYFCNKGEVEKFLKDPEPYLPVLIPRPAPAFSLPTPTGKVITLESLNNSLVLVDFWATWCGPCVKSMPEVQKIHEKYGSKGLTVLGISIDERGAKAVTPFLNKSKVKFTYPILLDTKEAWKQWGVKVIPTVMLVKDGKIVHQWVGKISPKELEAAIVSNLAPPDKAP